MSHALECELESIWPVKKWHDVRTLIAVSAGADSVALLRATLANSRNKKLLTVAHFNHGLRSTESDDDQQFVTTLCERLGVAFETAVAPRQSIKNDRLQIGIESAARNARYDFLTRTAKAIGARYILTAHTADDQAETVLHNICRGTGLQGVAGIPFSRSIGEAATVIRPLLHVTREQVITYLDEIKQDYRIDSSNNSDEFTRNRIRNGALPMLERSVNGATRKHLCQLAQIARESVEYLDAATDKLGVAILRQSKDELRLDCARLVDIPELLLVHFLKRTWTDQGWGVREIDANRWRRIATMIRQQDFAVSQLPNGIKCQRIANEMRFFQVD